MKQPPSDAVRVSADSLRVFLFAIARKIGIPEGQATLLARLLVENDLRGGFSHGSRQMVRYVREIRSGGINPTPKVAIVNETANSLTVDGDFGLGYFPAYEGTLRTIEKAKQHGMAAMVTRNHGHIGAAGIYARMTLEHDLLTFVTSGVQLYLEPGQTVVQGAGASPMSFSAPSLNEPPLVLDCGVTHDVQGSPPTLAEVTRLAPGMVLRALGFGTICQAWGGLLTGLPIDPDREQTTYEAANQGAMLFTFKISLFADPEAFKREIDGYAQRVRALKPLPGTEGAYLPGGVEAVHEAAYRRDGIPLSDSHRTALEKLAGELAVDVPWKR